MGSTYRNRTVINPNHIVDLIILANASDIDLFERNGNEHHRASTLVSFSERLFLMKILKIVQMHFGNRNNTSWLVLLKYEVDIFSASERDLHISIGTIPHSKIVNLFIAVNSNESPFYSVHSKIVRKIEGNYRSNIWSDFRQCKKCIGRSLWYSGYRESWFPMFFPRNGEKVFQQSTFFFIVAFSFEDYTDILQISVCLSYDCIVEAEFLYQH